MEPVDGEDEVPTLDERLDSELVARDVLVEEEEKTFVVFEASEEILPEFDRLPDWALPTPALEEELSVGTAVVVLLDELRPDEELEPGLRVEELCR